MVLYVGGSELEAGGITVADQWRLTSDIATDTSPLTNWERVDSSGQGSIGSAMTVSSGLFTFPSTGIYLVSATACGHEGSSTDNLVQFDFYYNSVRLFQVFQQFPIADGFATGHNSALADVTDVAQTGKFHYANASSPATELKGSSSINMTTATFIRLGDT